MTDKHTFFVCQFCASNWQDGTQVSNSRGYLLRQDLKTRSPDYS